MARVSRLRAAAANNRKILSGDEPTDKDKLARIVAAWCEAMKPQKKMNCLEWQDTYRFLPTETSHESGKWRTDRFPFLKLVAWLLSPQSPCEEIVVKKGAQLGFTEQCINFMLYVADQDPGPGLYLQKTKEAGEEFSTQKFDPNILLCPQVANKLGPNKPKHLTDKEGIKSYPGGSWFLGGVGSGSFLRSKSIRYAIQDEEDSYGQGVENEGDTNEVIKKRQVNFPNRKRFRLSTPKIKEISTIEPAFDEYTQERFYIPCPRCNPSGSEHGFRFWIKWEHIKYSKEVDHDKYPVDVYLECPSCGGRIEEHEKTWMLHTAGNYENFGYMSEKDSPGKPYCVDQSLKYRSFHVSSFYSPLGFFGWKDAARDWMKYLRTKDKLLLQVFLNQTAGETYSAAGQDVSAPWLLSRREAYPKGHIPQGVLAITSGWDVQGDRIEGEVLGTGLNGETWSLDYKVFYGQTEVVGNLSGYESNPTAWMQLNEFLQTEYVHPCGDILAIECSLIDTGYRAEPVHKFCQAWEGRRVYPVKGVPGWGRGLIKRPRRRHEQYKTWDFISYSDEMKDLIYENLTVSQPGPGYCHFPIHESYQENYFSGLTSETKKTKVVGGKKVLYWECPTGTRNEPLDVRGYAMAAFKVYAVDLRARAVNMQVAERLGPDLTPPPPMRVNRIIAKPKPKPVRRRGSAGF